MQQIEESAMPKTIVIPATLDTKGKETAFIKSAIELKGHRTIVIDVGVLSRARNVNCAVIDSLPMAPALACLKSWFACEVCDYDRGYPSVEYGVPYQVTDPGIADKLKWMGSRARPARIILQY